MSEHTSRPPEHVVPPEHGLPPDHVFRPEREESVLDDALVGALPRTNPFRPTQDPAEFRRATMIERDPVSSHPADAMESLNLFIDSVAKTDAKLKDPPVAFSWRSDKALAEASFREARAQAERYSGAIDDFIVDTAALARNGIVRQLGDGRGTAAERAEALASLEPTLLQLTGLRKDLQAWKSETERSPLDWGELTSLHDRLQADIENLQLKTMPTRLGVTMDAVSTARLGVAIRLAGLGAELARQSGDLVRTEGVRKVWPSETVAELLLQHTAQNQIAASFAGPRTQLSAKWSLQFRISDGMIRAGSPAEKRWTDARQAAMKAIEGTDSTIKKYRDARSSERDLRINDMILEVTELTRKLDDAAAELDAIKTVPDSTKTDLRDATALLVDEIRGRIAGLDAMMDARQAKRVKPLIDTLATFRKSNPTSYERDVAGLNPSKLAAFWSDAKDALIKELRNSGPAGRADSLAAAFDQNLRGSLTTYAREMAKRPKYSQPALHDAVWKLRWTLLNYRAEITSVFNTLPGSSNSTEQKFYRTLDLLQIAISNQLRQAAFERKGPLF
jgi:hypothetical protein